MRWFAKIQCYMDQKLTEESEVISKKRQLYRDQKWAGRECKRPAAARSHPEVSALPGRMEPGATPQMALANAEREDKLSPLMACPSPLASRFSTYTHIHTVRRRNERRGNWSSFPPLGLTNVAGHPRYSSEAKHNQVWEGQCMLALRVLLVQ